jgi:acyl carrier protein
MVDKLYKKVDEEGFYQNLQRQIEDISEKKIKYFSPSKLLADYSMDSLDILELTGDVENDFDTLLPDIQVGDTITPKNLYDLLLERSPEKETGHLVRVRSEKRGGYLG